MIAILGVLATVVVLVINPVQLLKQARDSTRLSDLYNINRILGLIQADNYSASFGTASTVYVSVPDSSATCANLGLPTLPSGYAYACVASSTLTKVDGTGWIPVDLTSFSAGSLLAKLPIDPTNTISSGLYYTYATGGSWELNAIPEAAKNRYGGGSDKVDNTVDGGDAYGLYEVGSDLTISPIKETNGLVGYWKLDEGSGTNAADSVNNSGAGTLTNGPTWTSGKIGSAVQCDGNNDYVNIPYNSVFDFSTGSFTITAYVIPSASQGKDMVSNRLADTSAYKGYSHYTVAGGYITGRIADGTNGPSVSVTSYSTSDWNFTAFVVDRSSNEMKSYLDLTAGTAADISTTGNISNGANALRICTGAKGYFSGKIDDVRVYNRALSAAEIVAIYNGTK